MTSITIAKGLKSTYKNARDYTLSQTFLELDKYTDNYEVLKPDFNRVYGDIDGKNIECSEEEFIKLDQETRKAIEDFLGEEPSCLMTASSFAHKKISWRFVLKNVKMTLADNKQWVKENINKINLPKGISFDTAPYNKNQKIRMLGSNKDGENRPLRLIKGEKIDTLISYIPEECQLAAPTKPEEPPKKKVVVEKKGGVNPILLRRLVLNIKNDAETDWDTWYRVSQAIFNAGADMDLFLEWSGKSPKHSERDAIKHWGSLKEKQDNQLTVGSIYYWSKLSDPIEYEKILFECADPESYERKKLVFEKTHFKLKNPVCFVREIGNNLQVLNISEISTLYQNMYFTDSENKQVVFINVWQRDSDIRTYEEMVFKPMKDVPQGCYNLFRGFGMAKTEGDISVMQDLMWNLSGKNKEVFDYIENYFAHLIQRPYQKAKKCLLFSTEKQGAGKDTPLDAIGKIVGSEYFFNTGDPENQVFGRFNGHLQKTLLLKLEEVSFEVNRKFESNLLNLITATTQSYENKGSKSINLDDYKRIVMTTNKSVPVNIPESDRRFVLINSSEDRVGDHEYWKRVYTELEKPETLEAYHWYLATKDISAFDLEKRPITDFYKDVKLALRPYHAQYFQQWLANNGDNFDTETRSAADWIKDMNLNSRFAVNNTKFGRDMKPYVDSGALVKKLTKYSATYTLNSAKMLEFLKSKGWWVEG